jgi:DNA (cytosine-5)-methyltransferase 1
MKGQLNVLDIFSGTGELGRAFHEGIKEALGLECRTIAYCEKERFPQAILLSRMWRGEIDHAPICTDVRELRAQDFFHGCHFAIVGGWPCQGNSFAGHRLGMEDERSGLIKEVIRLIEEFRPELIYLENVPGVLIARGDGVGYLVGELARLGYEFRHTLLSARQVGATHERNRFWILAHPSGHGIQRETRSICQEDGRSEFGLQWKPDNTNESMANTNGRGCGECGSQKGQAREPTFQHVVLESNEELEHASGQRCRNEQSGSFGKELEAGHKDMEHAKCSRRKKPKQASQDNSEIGKRASSPIERRKLPDRPPNPSQLEKWRDILRDYPEVEPALRGMVNGIAHRNHRIRAMGNGVDFPCAKEALKILLGVYL